MQIEETLGAGVNGTYASLAARLGQQLGGSLTVANLVSFGGRLTVPIAGGQHQLGSRNLIIQVYDGNVPRDAIQTGQITVHPSSFDVLVNFAAPQSGLVVLGHPTPLYATTFGPTTSLSIPAVTHGLAVPELLYEVYDAATPAAIIGPQTLTVHPTTREVTLTFATLQSGYVVLALGNPRFVATFTGARTLTIPGPAHGLGTAGLLFQCYDTATPRAAIQPQTFTVHPETYDVTLIFETPQSGSIVLAAVGLPATSDFHLVDSGTAGQSATQVYSEAGALSLQGGTSDRVYIRHRFGGASATFDVANGRLGLGGGLTNPLFQLHLAVDHAAKPGTNTWTIFSDERLKTQVRPFEDGLDLVLQLAPVWCRYNGKGGMPVSSQDLVSLLAQHLQPLAPYMVGSYRGKLDPLADEETDILTYEGHAMTFVLINAIKALHARVLALEEANATLRAQVAQTPTVEEPTS